MLADKVFDELHQQRAWWTRAHLTVEVARWTSEASPDGVEVEVERLAAMCLPLEPDSDVDYAQPDIAKLTSPTIMSAERRVLGSLDEPAPFTVTTVRDSHLGDDQIRAVRTITESRRRVTTIIGPAGAGKATMLRATGRSVDYAARDVTVLCLSAAAARVVTEETGMAANTIASWHIGQVDIPYGGVVIVDEASMVPTLVLDELVTSPTSSATGTTIKNSASATAHRATRSPPRCNATRTATCPPTIAGRLHAERPAQNAARAADRRMQQAETFWNKQLRSLPTRVQQKLAGEHTEIVRALARFDSNAERTAALRGASRVLSQPSATVTKFVAALSSGARRGAAGSLATSGELPRARTWPRPVERLVSWPQPWLSVRVISSSGGH